ncbi:hypothetical protein SAMN06297144_1186 [Sphingomonas guangdongensis]|uniref:Uncharacterized protein n=1 Tax=Sphingomonas guangdongensis TaxID=1141890 RepID=A0A285QKU2_9SPHN|nr:helix-turn-helix domain-containing protein [Sphingomonas guangdongensis]SOB80682.1 hypothetical protein SAMN06297144_1186 [Sphingomonas guangdongensis]
MTDIWGFMDAASNRFAEGRAEAVRSGTLTALADRIAEALGSASRADAEEAQARLEMVFARMLGASPTATRRAVNGTAAAESPEAAAFALGQIGFAHAVAARVASKRVEDGFVRFIRSKTVEGYVRALLGKELHNRALADALGKDEAEVSRVIGRLQANGVCDSRKEGNRRINFLTPAAEAVARDIGMGAIGTGRFHRTPPREVVRVMEQKRDELPAHLRHSLVLVADADAREAA